MLKKMTLLAMAVGALMAFAIPAVASADVWTLDDVQVGDESEAVTVDGTGTLSATLGDFELGPCLVHYHGDVWNDPNTNTGAGEITDFDIDAVHKDENGQDLCQVWTVEEEETVETICDITTAFTSISNPPFGAAWPIAVGPETLIEVEGANFTDVFSPECPLGPGGAAEGLATGTFAHTKSGSHIVFDGMVDHLKTPLGAPVDIDGTVTITPTDGGTLELSEP